jgi:hypothetical protein
MGASSSGLSSTPPVRKCKFAETTVALQHNILAFYQPPAMPIFDKKKPDHRNRTLRNIEELRAAESRESCGSLANYLAHPCYSQGK